MKTNYSFIDKVNISSSFTNKYNNVMSNTSITNPVNTKMIDKVNIPSSFTKKYNNTMSNTSISNTVKTKMAGKSLMDSTTTSDFQLPSSLMRKIKRAINTPSKTPKSSIFKFNNSERAAAFNSKLIRSMHMDFKKTIKAQGDSFLQTGSEFRSPSILAPLFPNIPDGPR